jgi:hypothetical protein
MIQQDHKEEEKNDGGETGKEVQIDRLILAFIDDVSTTKNEEL